LNLFEGARRNGSIDLPAENTLPMKGETDSQTVSLGVRPEDLTVSPDEPDTEWAITGTVETVEPLGEYVLVNVDVAGSLVNVKVSHTDVEPGQPVFITFDPQDAYLYDGDGMLVA